MPPVLVTAVARAPRRADFSGRWILDVPAIATMAAVPGTPASATALRDLGSGWGTANAVAQDAKQLSVEYAASSRDDLQPPLKLVYPLDGSEGRSTVSMGRGEQVDVVFDPAAGDAMIRRLCLLRLAFQAGVPELPFDANADVLQTPADVYVRFDPAGRITLVLGRKAEAIGVRPAQPAAAGGSGGGRADILAGAGTPGSSFSRATDVAGTVAGRFGGAGKRPEEFGLANSLDCRSEHELLVGEMTNWRLQRVLLER